jgi:hypothetical protein
VVPPADADPQPPGMLLHLALQIGRTVPEPDAHRAVAEADFQNAVHLEDFVQATEFALAAGQHGELERSLTVARLTQSAATARPRHSSDRDETRWLAATAVAEAAMHILAGAGIASVFDEGLAAADDLVALATQVEPVGELSHALLTRSSLYANPFSFFTPVTWQLGFRHWAERGFAAVLGDREKQYVPWQLAPDEMLAQAEKDLRLALTATPWEGEGEACRMLMKVLYWQQVVLDGPADDEISALGRRALRCLDVYDLPERLGLLAQMGPDAPPTEVERELTRLWLHSSRDLYERYGKRAAASAVLAAMQLLFESPARALSVAATHRPLIDDADPDLRGALITLEGRLFYLDEGLKAARAQKSPREVEAAAEDVALTPLDRMRRLTAAASMWASQGESRTDLVDAAIDLDPLVAQQHLDALLHVRGIVQCDTAASPKLRTDVATCLELYAGAADDFLAAGMTNSALESLHLLLLLLRDDGAARIAAGALAALVEKLAPATALLEAQSRTPATELLQTLWRRVLQLAAGAEADENTLVALFQLANASRFTTVKSGGSDYSVSGDVDAQQILSELTDLRATNHDQPAVTWRQSGLDELTLVRAFNATLPGTTNGGHTDLAAHLEQTFDELIQQRLLRDAAPPRLLTSSALRESLPAHVVVWAMAESYFGEDNRATCSLLLTRDDCYLVLQPQVAEGVQVEGAILSSNEALVAALRNGIVQDPGSAVVSTGPAEILPVFCDQYFGPVAQVLRDLRDGGKTHLVVQPHGPVNYFPLHLMGPLDRPLASEWTITYAPSLSYVLPSGSPHRPTGSEVAAFGMSFKGGGGHGLPPLRHAVKEVVAVAGAFGLNPYIDSQATESRVRIALKEARRVHIATHGRHRVAAPAFQAIYLWPEDDDGRLAAYELLDVDMTGLELVTLSACETALGRVDTAGNPRGIPASLLLRGAQALIGTLWPVMDATAFLFFDHLYQAIARGVPTVDAFLQAQHATRQAYPQYRDWGAFTYSGYWR